MAFCGNNNIPTALAGNEANDSSYAKYYTQLEKLSPQIDIPVSLFNNLFRDNNLDTLAKYQVCADSFLCHSTIFGQCVCSYYQLGDGTFLMHRRNNNLRNTSITLFISKKKEISFLDKLKSVGFKMIKYYGKGSYVNGHVRVTSVANSGELICEKTCIKELLSRTKGWTILQYTPADTSIKKESVLGY